MTANLINWKDTPESKWDTAVVVDVNDPQKALRVKIRVEKDRKSTRLNSSHVALSRMPSSA